MINVTKKSALQRATGAVAAPPSLRAASLGQQQWRHSWAALAALTVFLAGCARAPAIDVQGSFFPAWIICLTIAVFLTFAIRYLLVRLRIESEVGPLVVFYPSLLTLMTIMIWMSFFR
jgi:hypothetical protein